MKYRAKNNHSDVVTAEAVAIYGQTMYALTWDGRLHYVPKVVFEAGWEPIPEPQFVFDPYQTITVSELAELREQVVTSQAIIKELRAQLARSKFQCDLLDALTVVRERHVAATGELD